MPLTAYCYNTDMTNQRLAQSGWNKDGSLLQSYKHTGPGFDPSSLFLSDHSLPPVAQDHNSRLDSGFFDQLSFGDRLGLNNSCGSDKLSGTNACTCKSHIISLAECL